MQLTNTESNSDQANNSSGMATPSSSVGVRRGQSINSLDRYENSPSGTYYNLSYHIWKYGCKILHIRDLQILKMNMISLSIY